MKGVALKQPVRNVGSLVVLLAVKQPLVASKQLVAVVTGRQTARDCHPLKLSHLSQTTLLLWSGRSFSSSGTRPVPNEECT